MTTTDHCATCRMCTKRQYNYKSKTCQTDNGEKIDLFTMLKAATPPEVWITYRRPQGRPRRPIHLGPYKQQKRNRAAPPREHPLPTVRKELKDSRERRTLTSQSPRISTAAKFGPNILALPGFPRIFEAPETQFNEVLEQQRIHRKMRPQKLPEELGKAMDKRLKFAESLVDEPLLAMALKSTTDLKYLELLLDDEEHEQKD